jgi:hypothetical protein
VSTPMVTIPVAELMALVEHAAERGAERALAGLLGGGDGPLRAGHLVDTATIARELGYTEQWVREHGRELGGQQSSERAPWRFDLELARERYAAMACYGSRQSQPDGGTTNPNARADSEASRGRPRKRRGGRMPNRMPPAGSILQARPRQEVH